MKLEKGASIKDIISFQVHRNIINLYKGYFIITEDLLREHKAFISKLKDNTLDDIDIDGLNNFCGPELNIDDFIDVNDVLSSLGIDSLSADAFMQAASQYLDQYDKLRKEYIPLSSPSNSYYPHFMIHYPARRLRYILDSYEDSNPPITERTVEYEHGKMSQEIAENQRNEFIKDKFKKAVAEAKEKMGGKSMEQLTQIAEEAFNFNIEGRKFWNQASKNYLTVHAKKKAKGSS